MEMELTRRCSVWFKDQENMKTSMIDVFATFLLLSYSKILSVNFDLLAFTTPVSLSGKTVGRYLYYDASYEWFGPDHLPYGIVAILSFFFINVFPFLLLLLYPMKCFQKILNHLRLSHVTLHIFVDSFAGCYKDGTEPGTRDCRYFAAMFLFLRILLYIIYQATLSTEWYGWAGLIITGFTIHFIMAQPYKAIYKRYNTITTVMFGIIILLTIALLNINIAYVKAHQSVNATVITAAILFFLPQFYVIGICISWMYNSGILKCLSMRQKLQRSSSKTSLLSNLEHRGQK